MLRRNAVTVELDEIQATVLRYRPEPYCGSHILLRIDEQARWARVPPQARTAHRLRRRVVAARRSVDRGGAAAISYSGGSAPAALGRSDRDHLRFLRGGLTRRAALAVVLVALTCPHHRPLLRGFWLSALIVSCGFSYLVLMVFRAKGTILGSISATVSPVISSPLNDQEVMVGL